MIEKISKKKSWFDSVPNLLCLCVWILDLQRSKFRKPVKVNLVFFLVLFASVWRFVTILLICGTFWTFYHFWTILWQGPVFGVAHKQPGGGGHQQRQGESKAVKKIPKYDFLSPQKGSSERDIGLPHPPGGRQAWGQTWMWVWFFLLKNLNVSLILFNKNYVCEKGAQKLLSMHCNGLNAYMHAFVFLCCFVCVFLFFCVFFHDQYQMLGQTSYPQLVHFQV